MKKRFIFIFVIVVFLFSLIVSFLGVSSQLSKFDFSFESENRTCNFLAPSPICLYSSDLLSSQGLQTYNDYFLYSDPVVSADLIGNSSAPLFFGFVVDFTSGSSAQSYDFLMPYFRERFLQSGESAFYHKYFLTKSDFADRSQRYYFSAYSVCASHLYPSSALSFNRRLFSSDFNSLNSLVDEFNFDVVNFRDCSDTYARDVLFRDMIESERILIQSPSVIVSIRGDSLSYLYGLPSETLINNTIRSKEIVVGI